MKKKTKHHHYALNYNTIRSNLIQHKPDNSTSVQLMLSDQTNTLAVSWQIFGILQKLKFDYCFNFVFVYN